jgi:hypothetical protein
MKIIPGYRDMSRGFLAVVAGRAVRRRAGQGFLKRLRRPGPAKTSSCGVQHDHEEKASYARAFLS